MQTDNKIQLLQNFLNGSITDQELKNLFVWLNSEKGNLEFEKLLNEKWLTNKYQTTERIDSTILFSRIKAKIEDRHLSGRKQLFIRFRKVAAIFILGLLIPTMYFVLLNPQKDNKKVVYLKESLSNEKIKKMTLPDGTAVWLMSGSTITYPSNFTGNKTRNVEITGEAFFNVAKDSLHPFILKLGEVGLKVVGTSFNVMNYDDEDRVNVVLKTGKVDMFKGKYNLNDDFVHLAPGQLMTYKKGELEFLVSNVDVAKYTSWINGTLLFRDDRFEEVLKKLGKWYNITIEIKDSEVSDFLFTATIKNENLDQIVDLLKYSTPFKYSIYKTDGVTKLVVEKK